jgi:hypothetical protein
VTTRLALSESCDVCLVCYVALNNRRMWPRMVSDDNSINTEAFIIRVAVMYNRQELVLHAPLVNLWFCGCCVVNNCLKECQILFEV